MGYKIILPQVACCVLCDLFNSVIVSRALHLSPTDPTLACSKMHNLLYVVHSGVLRVQLPSVPLSRSVFHFTNQKESSPNLVRLNGIEGTSTRQLMSLVSGYCSTTYIMTCRQIRL